MELIVNFEYIDKDRDGEYVLQFSDLGHIPRVGEHVEIRTNRNYQGALAPFMTAPHYSMGGYVVKITSTISETGQSPGSCVVYQQVCVLLDPMGDDA